MLTGKLTIKQHRMIKELSQQFVADKIGIHVNTYRRLEKNPQNASAKNVANVARLLGISVDELF